MGPAFVKREKGVHNIKLLYLPLLVPGGACEQFDLLDAFQMAARGVGLVRYFDYNSFRGDCNKELIRIFKTVTPDIMHMQIQENKAINISTLHLCKQINPSCIFTQWCGDVRDSIIPKVVEVGKLCDYNLFSNEGQLSDYERAIGKKCYYWQNAVAPRFYGESLPLEKRWGIVFIGNNYGDRFNSIPRRYELVEALFRKFGSKFRLYGNNWNGKGHGTVPWSKQCEIYQTAWVTISHNNVITDRYFSDRTLIMMAAGGVPHVCHYSPGLEKDFVDGEDVLYWRTIDEAIDKLEWVLNNQRDADLIGKNGFQKIIKYHNWDVRVQEYQKILNIELNVPPGVSFNPNIQVETWSGHRRYRSMKGRW